MKLLYHFGTGVPHIPGSTAGPARTPASTGKLWKIEELAKASIELNSGQETCHDFSTLTCKNAYTTLL
jgi:hypothetical protein